ncbi:hypothetical protein Ahy_B10g104465 [Arachis hypogaea]|uniref:Uncharacterized protein n=1 Tax=Arachis hypogaea TaxID=3818 RepID=A0A444X5J0_ARAHY|nr:hypothetical protein Ahy_B10g104465 [Arachis hypogaea]
MRPLLQKRPVLIGASQADDQRDVIVLDGIGSFGAIDFDAFRIKGFSIRRSKVGHCKKARSEGDVIWQIFMCSRQGERDAKHVHRTNRKMDPRPINAMRV